MILNAQRSRRLKRVLTLSGLWTGGMAFFHHREAKKYEQKKRLLLSGECVYLPDDYLALNSLSLKFWKHHLNSHKPWHPNTQNSNNNDDSDDEDFKNWSDARIQSEAYRIHDRLIDTLCQLYGREVIEKEEFRLMVVEGFGSAYGGFDGTVIVYGDNLKKMIQVGPGAAAFVIAHEIAHILLKHVHRGGINEMRYFMKDLLLGPEHCDTAQGFWSRSIFLPILRFTRMKFLGWSEELEADKYGLLLMKQAGYDPNLVIKFFQSRLDDLKDEKEREIYNHCERIFSCFSPHPPTSIRIANLEMNMPLTLRSPHFGTEEETSASMIENTCINARI